MLYLLSRSKKQNERFKNQFYAPLYIFLNDREIKSRKEKKITGFREKKEGQQPKKRDLFSLSSSVIVILL
jgi:hypothetical protein